MLTTQIWCRDASWSIHVGRFYWIFTFSFPWQICSVEVVSTSKCNSTVEKDQFKKRCHGICGACPMNLVMMFCKRRVGTCMHSPPPQRVNCPSCWWNSGWHHADDIFWSPGILSKQNCRKIPPCSSGPPNRQNLQAKNFSTTKRCIGAGAPGLELIESIKEEQASSTLQEIKGEIGCVEEPTFWGVDSFVLFWKYI